MKRKFVMTTVLVASMIVSAAPTLAVVKSEAKPERSAVAVKAEAKPERSAVAVKAEAKPERVKAVAMRSDGPIVPELPAVPFV